VNEIYIDTRNQTQAEIYTIQKDILCQYILELPIKFYKIDENKWKEIDEYIWYDDIKFQSKLYIKNINFDKVYLKDKYNNICELQTNDKHDTIDISVIKNYDKKHLKIIFQKDNYQIGEIQILSSNIYVKEQSSINYDPENERLQINTNNIRKNKVILKIENEKRKIPI